MTGLEVNGYLLLVIRKFRPNGPGADLSQGSLGYFYKIKKYGTGGVSNLRYLKTNLVSIF